MNKLVSGKLTRNILSSPTFLLWGEGLDSSTASSGEKRPTSKHSFGSRKLTVGTTSCAPPTQALEKLHTGKQDASAFKRRLKRFGRTSTTCPASATATFHIIDQVCQKLQRDDILSWKERHPLDLDTLNDFGTWLCPAGTKNGSAFDERNRNNIDQSCSVIYSFTKKFFINMAFPSMFYSLVCLDKYDDELRLPKFLLYHHQVWHSSCVVSSYHFNYLNFGRYLSCFYSRTCTGKEGLVYPIFSPATNVNRNVNKLSFVLPVARLRICLWSRLALSVANFLVRASAKHHVY